MTSGEHEPATVRELMSGLRNGNRAAADRLIELFYPGLRRMAAARMMRERPDHTLQPTALVNELYLEMAKVHDLPPGSANAEAEKAQFLGLAGFLMKRMLIHHARPLYRRAEKTEIPESLEVAGSDLQVLSEIEDLLDRLARIDPALRQVVEMKAFEGLSREQIAGRLGCSLRTVARRWDFARQWLQEALSGTEK